VGAGSQQDEENQLQRATVSHQRSFSRRSGSTYGFTLEETIERETRISRPGDENARCRASRAEDHGHRQCPLP